MIELNNVSKKYKSRTEEEVYAIKDCSLSFGKKSFVVITGKSGSGKTTLINLIGSLDTPSSGNILYNKKSILSNSMDYRNKVVGFIFQEHNLFEHLTVKENIRLSLELQGLSVSDNVIIDVLRKVSLEEYIDKYPNELSTGQHQRCAIARALVKSPEVIIADEPTGSLDDKTGNQIMELLKKLSEEYLVIMVTHNLVYSKKYADRHIVLENGVIVRDQIINETFEPNIIFKKCSYDNEQSLTISAKINFVNKFLKKNIKHTIRTIIMLSLSMFLMILFYTITSINESKIIYETITGDCSDNIYYLNNTIIRNENDFYTELNTGFFNQDILDMKIEYHDNEIIPIYRNSYISLESYVNSPNNLLFSGEISGLIEIDTNVLKNFNYDLIEGNLPEKSSDNQVEVAITKFFYEYLKEYGIGEMKFSEYKDVIGRIFTFKNINYKITGIVDTNYNIDYYTDYFLKVNSKIDKNIKEQYAKLMESEVHTILFVPNNYFKKIIMDDSSRYQVRGLDDVLRITSISSKEPLSNQIFYISKYTNRDYIVWDNSEVESLDTHEVIIDLSLLNINNINNRINNLISTFAENYYSEISNDFESEFPNSTYQNYAEYILSHETNPYHLDKTYKSFQYDILKEVMNEINSKNPSITTSSIKGQFKDKVKVVGIDLSYRETVTVSETNFNLIKNISSGPYDTVMIKSSKNYNKDKIFFESFINYKNIDNSVLNTFYEFLLVYNSFHIFSVILLIFLTLITIILVFYFINDLLKNVRIDIGLLLALGTEKRGIRQIYITIISICMLISQMIGFLLLLVFLPTINSYFQTKFKLFVDIFYLDLQSAIYPIAIVFLFYSISSYISMLTILNKKSIKTLYYH